MMWTDQPHLPLHLHIPTTPETNQTCKEFGVDYKNYDSFSTILASVHECVFVLVRVISAGC